MRLAVAKGTTDCLDPESLRHGAEILQDASGWRDHIIFASLLIRIMSSANIEFNERQPKDKSCIKTLVRKIGESPVVSQVLRATHPW